MHALRVFAASCLLTFCGAAQTRLFESSGDVGLTPEKGKVEFDGSAGAYRVTGGGDNIWGTTDAFQFAWTRLSGDIALTADVRFIGTGVVAHRKAALMIRQSLDPGSAYADVAVHGDGLTSLQYRQDSGAITQEIRSDLKAPVRIRIERRGSSFVLYAGAPGEDLKPTGPATVILHDPVYAGIAVSSHKADVLETAVFSNVRVEHLTPRPRFSSKLVIYDLKTRNTRTVYEAKEVFEAPNWSRDGKYLLINMRGRLFRVPVNGGAAEPEPVNIDSSLRCNNDHDLSPDGKLIALSASSQSSRGSQVYVASVDGSNARLVVAAAPSYFHGWSPDGKYLAFVGQRNGKFNLFRVPETGGPEERLTFNSPYDDGPDYSRDGKWIYFNSNRSGSWHVWRMPATGAGPDDSQAQQVTHDELEDWFPHPSPDGKWLLVFSFPKGTTGHNDRLEGVQLRLLPMPGAKLKPAKLETLTTFFGGQGTINVNSWSPDSRQFAFVTYEPLKDAASSAPGNATRPRIDGIAHIGIYASNFERSRAFYRDFLGFEEPYSLAGPDGTPAMAFFKINEKQYIELFPEKDAGTDRLSHISIETNDAEAMRRYLAARGVAVPAKVGKGRIGNSNFNIKDPEGHTVEIVQYEPDGWTVRERGKHLPDTRIEARMSHVGIIVTDLEPEMKFYRDLLGFRETWRGSKSGTELSWVNLRVPDGRDYIEFMLYRDAPAPTARGSAHHLCLEVKDVPAAIAALDAKPYRKMYTRQIEPRVGVNRKRQANLFDPDGTRTELMEPETIDGVPTPPSTAPPPR